MVTRKGLEARNGQSWAALRRTAAIDRTVGPQGWTVFEIPSTRAPLICSIGNRRSRLGASQHSSSSSGTNLLSWAGTRRPTMARARQDVFVPPAGELMRQAPRRSCSIMSGISAPRDERRTAAHSVPAAAPYWRNQSNGPCQGRSVGSEDQSSNHRGHGRPPTFSLTFSPSRSFPFTGTARAYNGRINHRRAGVPWPVRARTTVGVILRGAPRQQEQQPAGFHGGLCNRTGRKPVGPGTVATCYCNARA